MRHIEIFSEVGTLKSVLLHRPGRELESLTPQYLDSMLFEDIPYLEQMQQEHDSFAQLLRDEGSEVLYVEELLKDVLVSDQRRREAAQALVDASMLLSPSLREVIRDYVLHLDAGQLVQTLIGGLLKHEIDPLITEKTLSYYIRDAYPYYINPLPNLYFTRDPATAIGRGVSINRMKTESRIRENWMISLIMKYHPRFQSVVTHESYAPESSIEGGDILMLSEDTVAVGCSARTSVQAIEDFTRQMTSPVETGGQGVKQVLVIQIPFTRAYMHLDTVFTMVDRDAFCIYGGVEPQLHTYLMTRGSGDRLTVQPESSLVGALEKVLKLPSVRLIRSGGGDSIAASREQWNDSTNTFAVAPGRVVTYRRNVVSNDTLEQNGITVLPIRGSELVRGRGGPRCMSMPLVREPLL